MRQDCVYDSIHGEICMRIPPKIAMWHVPYLAAVCECGLRCTEKVLVDVRCLLQTCMYNSKTVTMGMTAYCFMVMRITNGAEVVDVTQ